MEDQTNPYILYNNHPKFPRKKRISFVVSNEAYNELQILGEKLTTTGQLADLLEEIGLHLLTVSPYENIVDNESGVTTDECRQSGYEDGRMGNPQIFFQIYGKLKTPFESAYTRGFIEGSYIRNK